MVWQFADRFGDKKGDSFLSTGGLSALEEAFDVLGYSDPHKVADCDAICDVFGCGEFVTNQGTKWGNYWCLCSPHGVRKEKPKMKQRAIDRENRRDSITHYLPMHPDYKGLGEGIRSSKGEK